VQGRPVGSPQQQQAALIRTTEITARYQPGFGGGNIHKSLDGALVVDDARWRNREDL
jgi:hypothetical protein